MKQKIMTRTMIIYSIIGMIIGVIYAIIEIIKYF